MSDARIVIGADGSQAMAELERLKGAFSNSMTSIKDSTALATKAVGLLAAGGYALSFANSIKQAIDLADHLNKLSQRTGIATESLSQLQYAAKLADVSSDSLTTGLKKLNVSIANGIAGDKEKVAVFKALGVTLTDTSGKTKTADQVLLDLADTFAKSKDGAGKTAAAVALLGKAGDEMIPLLNGGGEALRELMKEADKLGLTISSDFAARAEAFNDNLTRLGTGGQKLAIVLGSDLVDALTLVVQALTDDKLNAASGPDSFANKLGAGLRNVIEAISILGINVKYVFEQIGAEIGGIAAQGAALARLDFNGFNAISDALKADGVRSRKELDGLEQRILGFNKSVAGAGRGALSDPRILGTVGTISQQANAWKGEIKIPDKSGAVAAEKESEYAKLNKQIQEQIDLDIRALTLGRELTEAEKFRIKITNDMNLAKVGLTATERKAIETKLGEKEALDLLAQIQKSEFDQAKQIATERQRIRNADFEAVQKHIEGERDLENARNKSMRDTLRDLADETAGLSMTNAQREIAIKLREAERLGLIKGSAAYSEYEAKITAAVVKKDTTDEGIKQQVGMWQTIEGAAKDTFLSIFDSGKSAFTRLKDTLKNGLYALLYEMTVKKWLISIAASVSGAGVAQQALGATTSGDGIGGLGGLASSISTLSSGVNLLTGGLTTGLGTAFASGFSAAAAGLTPLVATSVTTGAAIGGATGLASGAGAALGALGPAGWVALAALAAFAIFKKEGTPSVSTGSLSRNYDAQGRVISSASNFGEGNAGSTLDRLQAGYASLRDAMGAKGGSSFAYGGYSGNDNKNPMARIMGNGFDSGEFAQNDANMQLAASRAIFAALKSSELPRELSGLFNKLDPNTISQADIDKVYEYGQALKALDANLLASPFTNLKNLSYEAAQALIAASGGLAQLNTNLVSYYDNFYTAEEKRNRTVGQITDTLNAAGGRFTAAQVGSASRGDFRSVFESATTPELKAALLAVSAAFAGITPEASAAAQATAQITEQLASARKSLEDQIFAMQNAGNLAALRAKELAALDPSLRTLQATLYGLQDAAAAAARTIELAASAEKRIADARAFATTTEDAGYATLERAVNAQRTAAQAGLQVAQQNVTTIRSIFDALKSNVKDLYGQVDSTRMQAAGQGNAFIAQALATAKASGYLPDAGALADAISASRSGIDSTIYATEKDREFAQLVLAGQLSQLKDVSGHQLTEAERMVQYAESQLGSLDGLLENARMQIEIQRGTYQGVLAIPAALQAFADSMRAAGAARTAAGATNATSTTYSTADVRGYLENAALTGQTDQSIGYAAIAKGVSSLQIDEALKRAPGTTLARALELGLPAFAGGGTHAGGWAMVGEQGPELAFMPPARIYNAPDTRSMMSGGGSDAGMAELKAEVRMLREELQKVTANTGKTTYLIDQVTDGGNAVRNIPMPA